MGLWTKLTAICMVISECEADGISRSEIRYFIGSVDTTAEQYLGWVRGHWGIENSLHWVLDVCFREDEQRHWAGNSAENLSWLRKLALCLLKAEKNSRVYAPQWDNQEVWESLTADSSPVWLTRRSTSLV
jgi:predicted transposase YbfD/YdcC